MPDALPSLDLLLRDGAPAGGSLPPEPDEDALCALYAVPAGRRTVRANMVSTVDGAAWGATGRSGSINNDADLRVFHVLRALADVVLVGAGTARAEGYTPLAPPPGLIAARRRAGLPDHLETALITRAGDLPAQITDPRTYPAGATPPLVLTTARGAERLAPGYPTERVVVTGEDDVDLAAALDALEARGLTRILTEGGPSLLGALLEAGLVDELCLTTSPLVVGGPATRTVHTSTYLQVGRQGNPADAPPARLAHLLHADGVLLARWLLTGAADDARR